MELLDLPPEVFQQVMHQYVAKFGVGRAWKNREVCKTFHAIITEEIFVYQPEKAYSGRAGKALLRNGLPIFLEYRVNASRGAHDLIPSTIRKAIDRIMEITQETSKDSRKRITRQVCTAVAKFWKAAHVDVFKPTPHNQSRAEDDTDDAQLLCLVVGIGDLDLIRLVLEHCEDPWVESFRLGSPIQVAVRTKNFEAMKLLLAGAKLNKRRSSAMFSRMINSLFYLGFHMDNSKVKYIEKLLSLYRTFLGRPDRGYCFRWLSHPYSEQTIGISKKVLDMGFTSFMGDQYIRGLFGWWSARPQPLTLKLFKEQKILNMEAIYTYQFFQNEPRNIKDESILCYAVRIGDIHLLEAALELGANPNGAIKPNGQREYPIRYPILNHENGVNALELLLAYGADLDGNDPFFKDKDLRTVKTSEPVRRLLDEAFKQKKYAHIRKG